MPPPLRLAKLFTRLDRIRALAFDRTLPTSEALGRMALLAVLGASVGPVDGRRN